MSKKLIKIAHSPDSDDAFMFYALGHGKVVSEKYDFVIERRDIEELNVMAHDEIFDITAISMHAYAHVCKKYALTSSGASMAEKDYGPMVIVRNDSEIENVNDLKDKTVAVPGLTTTACLVLKMLQQSFKALPMRFDTIMEAVKSKKVDAGLLIHEGQLQFEREGFKKVASLIDYWKTISSNLPLPLGGNAVKKSLGQDVMKELSALQKQSIVYAREHRDEAREYAMQFKRDLSHDEAEKYLNWYANDRTLDMGAEGRAAVELLLSEAHKRGLLSESIEVEII